uniref:Transposase n=1 Tax=Strongyloides papillosus TaxID=174720 RepID=A0A0N5BZM4_STREA
MKNSAISSKLGVPLRTVQKIVKQWREEGHVQTKPGRGRKRTVNTRRMRGIIKKRIERKDDRSLIKMAKELKISRKSVQMIVKNELGLRSYRPLNGQVLTEQAKQNRKEKCKKLRDFFKVRRKEDVLWSDEKVFTVEVAKNSQNHRQHLSPALKNTRKRKIGTRSQFPKSLIVWGGISALGKIPLLFIDKNVKINSKIYQEEILKKAVVHGNEIIPIFFLNRMGHLLIESKQRFSFSRPKSALF